MYFLTEATPHDQGSRPNLIIIKSTRKYFKINAPFIGYYPMRLKPIDKIYKEL